jgi:homocysteine S-methyltransferase
MAQTAEQTVDSDAAQNEVKAAVARLFSGGTVLCDGAMGSMLYGRGVFINRCYDELNVSQPDLIRAVHTEYLQAGAMVIESNTFGANAVRLERYGLEGRVWELNTAGVRLARECVNQMREKHASDAFVAGAIGPLGIKLGPESKLSEGEAYAAFAQQVKEKRRRRHPADRDGHSGRRRQLPGRHQRRGRGQAHHRLGRGRGRLQLQ